MSLAVKPSAAEKLVPMVYPWRLRGTPERSPSVRVVRLLSLQDGRAVPAPYWFAKAEVADNNLAPPESLGTLLFAPATRRRAPWA
jgi:hypothetical protein